jgi:hypothetical protein
VFLGTIEGGNAYKIVIDFWSTSNDDWEEATPPDLYLPHVPPALLCKAEDAWIANPSLKAAYAPECVRYSENAGVLDPVLRAVHDNPIFRVAVKRNFQEKEAIKRQQCLRVAQEYAERVRWTETQIPVPVSLREEALSVVGKIFRLEGGIEMFYLLPPVLCFANLNKPEFSWCNGSPYPTLKAPMVAYRIVDDAYYLVRMNQFAHAYFAEHPSTRLTSSEKDGLFFKTFIAAAEFQDVMALYAEWGPARQFAMAHEQEEVVIQAAHKLLDCLVKIHPHPSREEAYFLYEIGALHDSRASCLIRDGQDKDADRELILAAQCYHSAAMKTHQFASSRSMRFIRYNALGVTFMRLGKLELAKRAFLWAMTDPTSWSIADIGKRDLLGNNLVAWWEGQQMGETKRSKQTKKALKDQRKANKKVTRYFSVENCQHCKKVLQQSRTNEKSCSRCFSAYCSRECQELDWPEHKKICTRRKEQAGGDMVLRIGACTGSTLDLLGSVNWANMAFTLSLAEANQLRDHWNPPSEITVQIPQWLMAEAAELIPLR